MPKNVPIEKYLFGVRDNGGLLTNKPVTINSNLTVNGTITSSGTGMEGAQVITATSANALSVGQTGTTNPALNVNTNTASSATGLDIVSAAAAGGLALSTLSSGTNENLTIDAKGSGTVTINGTATGIVVLPAGTTIGGSVPLTSTITSSSASAFQVGQGGATNPAFLINASATTSATGVSVTSAAAGGGAALATISSASNENMTIDAKGSGTITIGSISTGKTSISQGLIVTSASTQAVAFGRTGGANPGFSLNSNTTGAVTGIILTQAAAGAGIALATISSASNENMTLAAKGSGTVTFNPATAATAGGASGDGVMYGSIGVGIFTGTGAPTFSAMNGSVYTNSAATTTTTRIYVNNSGAGTAGTTWTALTTAA